MKQLLKTAIIWLYVFLCILNTAWADAQDTSGLVDKGKELYEKGEYRAAMVKFKEAAEKKEDPETYVFLGIALYGAGEYRAAIDCFNNAMSLDARYIPTAYYYTGFCQAGLTEYSNAIRSFEQAARSAEGTKMGIDAKNKVSQLRKYVKAKKRERPWYVRITPNILWDTNVLTAGDNVVLPSDISNKSDFGYGISILAGLRPYKGEKSEIWMDFKGNTVLYDKLSDYDTLIGSLCLRGTYDFTDRLEAGMKAGYEYTWVGWDSFSRIINISPSVSYLITKWTRSTIAYTWQDKDYMFEITSPALDRDGYTRSISFTQDAAIPETKLSVRVGIEQAWTESKGADYDYNSFKISLALWHPFIFETRIIGGVSYKQSDYDNPNSRSATGEVRDDETLKLYAGLNKDITDNITAFIAYYYTDNNSNIDAYDYDRSIYYFGVTYGF